MVSVSGGRFLYFSALPHDLALEDGEIVRHARNQAARMLTIMHLAWQEACKSSMDDLRHYFASLLIASGADVKTVQARLRHASAKTTLDTYGHIWPDRDESTRTAVKAVIAARAEQWRNSGEQPTRRRRSGPV
jgi:integrase